jgi:hypothetical protein
MAKLLVKLSVILTVLLLGFPRLYAQSIDGKLGIGLQMGTSVFFGDIKKNEWWPSLGNPNEIGFGMGLQSTYNFTPYFSLKGVYLNGNLKGANMEKNQQFKANFNEFTIRAMFNMSTIFFENPDRAWLDVYGVVGYGINSFRSVRTSMEDGRVLGAFGFASNGTTKTRTTRELSIPVGISLKSRVGYLAKGSVANDLDRLEINLDIMLHLVNTDKLDALQSGDGRDNFTFFSAGVSYFFMD